MSTVLRDTEVLWVNDFKLKQKYTGNGIILECVSQIILLYQSWTIKNNFLLFYCSRANVPTFKIIMNVHTENYVTHSLCKKKWLPCRMQQKKKKSHFWLALYVNKSRCTSLKSSAFSQVYISTNNFPVWQLKMCLQVQTINAKYLRMWKLPSFQIIWSKKTHISVD